MLNFAKSKSSSGWLSLLMVEGRVDVAQVVRPDGGKPRVVLADSFERGGDDVQTLRALRKSLNLAARRCTTLLPAGRYQLLATDAVEGPVSEAREAIRWKIKDQVEFPVDNAAIDLLPIPTLGTSRQVFAAIAPESVVAPVVQNFQAAKVPLAAIDLPELAQRNLAALFEESGRALAMLAFGESDGLLTFTAGGELLVVRRVEISARQLMSADTARREMLFERIGLDVQRSLDNFDRNFSVLPLSRLLVTAIPGVEGFVEYLRANLALPVASVNLESVMDLDEVPNLKDPMRQFQSLMALGAALRDESEAA